MNNYLTSLAALLLAVCSLSAQTIMAEHHFESADIQEVSVVGSFCDVYITKGDQVIFDGVIEGNGDKDDYLIASIKSGSKVIFKVERKNNRGNWNWQSIRKARFDITIPDDVFLKVDNSSGDVKVEGISGNDYIIETSSGDIFLKDISGKLKARSTSGDVVIDNLSGNIDMQSTSGDQEYRKIVGNLETRATSGDIDIRDVKGNLYAKTTSGDIEIDDVEGSLSLNATSGNLEGYRVLLADDSNAQSTSGDIYLEFLNELELIGFDLKATSGDLRVGTVRGEDRLVLRRGSITFEGTSTSGDQTYKD